MAARSCIRFFNATRIAALLVFVFLILEVPDVSADPVVRSFEIRSGDMVEDPSRGWLWLSGRSNSAAHANSVIALDPQTMTVQRSFAVGPDPVLLALSDNSRYLYVSLEGAPGYQRIDLEAEQVSPRYTLETGTSGPNYVMDMAVPPGDPLALAVVVRSAGSFQQLGIFDDGVARPDAVSWSHAVNRIAFAGDGSALFGHNGISSGFDFRRFVVDQNGVRHRDSIGGLVGGFGVSLRRSGDWMFSGDGVLFDPDNLRIIGHVPEGGTVDDTILDRDLGKFFQVEGLGNRNIRLTTYDAATFVRLRNLTVSGSWPRPIEMARWGNRGLAVRTADNIIVVEDDLVRVAGAEADLRTEVIIEPVQRIVDETFFYGIRLANAGPDVAELIHLSHRVPEGFQIVSATAPGKVVPKGRESFVEWDWAALNVGEVREVVVEAKVATSGRFHIAAEASSDTRDRQPASMVGEGWLHVNSVARDHAVLGERALVVKDMVVDAGSGLIYASVDREDRLYPSRVVAIDPATGDVVRSYFVGADPGPLAISAEEGLLYVATQNGFNVSRIALHSGEVDLNFGLGLSTHGHTNQLRFAKAMRVLPGAPNSLAVAMRTENSYDRLAVFDSGVARAEESAFGYEVTSIAFNDTGDKIYGFDGSNSAWDFRKFGVGASGITHVASERGLLSGWANDLTHFDGMVYSSAGTVIDPAAMETAGFFGGSSSGRMSLALLPERDRALFLQSGGEIEAFAMNSFTGTAKWVIPAVTGARGPLLVLEDNRMVFLREDSLLFIESTIADLNPSRLTVEVENPPVDMRVGMEWTYRVKVTNTGTEPAHGLRISQPAVTSLSRAGVETTKGTVSFSSNAFTVNVETIEPGETVEVAVTIRPNSVRSYKPTLTISTIETDVDPSVRVRELSFAARATGVLKVEIPEVASEGDGNLGGAGKVELGEVETFDVVVLLTSALESKVKTPPSVTIPAGALSATFDLEILDDDLLDGTHSVTITARAAGFTSDSASIRVLDNESAAITLVLPQTVRRGESAVGEITIDGIPSRPVSVTLIAGENEWLDLPQSVVIPAGADRAQFEIHASEVIPPLEGAAVTVTANVPGWVPGEATVRVLPPAPGQPFNPLPRTSGEFTSSSPTLTWNNSTSVQLVVNGDFSRGDFHGWKLETSENGGWAINDGTFDPPGPAIPQPPFSPDYAAISYQTGGGTRELSQEILLPFGTDKISLRWRHRIQNAAGQYVPGEHAFRVEVYERDGAFRETLFETFPRFPSVTTWQLREVDLTRFQGEWIRLAFIQEDTLGSLNVSLDDVSVTAQFPRAEAIEGDVYDVYLGKSPYLGEADFIGTVDVPRLPLSGLERGATYYWQVVVRRGNEAVATPVWTFRTAAVEVAIIAPEGPTAEETLDFEVVFTDPVHPPSLDSFMMSNVVAASITGDGNRYTITVVPRSYGYVSLILPENAVQTLEGEGNAVSGTASVHYIGSATFERWRQFYFTRSEQFNDPEGTGRDGDAGDVGMPNLLRYAVGMMRGEVDLELLPKAVLLRENGEVVPGLVFHWQPDSLDVDYVIEVSENLVDWREGGESIEVVSVEDAGETKRITVREKNPDSEIEKRFMRLRVIGKENPETP